MGRMPTIAQELADRPLMIVEDPDGARQVIGLRLLPDVRDPGRVLLDLHRSLRHLAGDYGPRSVDLPGAVPDFHALQHAFGAEVRLQRPNALLRLPTGVLSEQAGFRRSTLAGQVRDELRERLGSPDLTLASVAWLVGMDPRTVQRVLREEGLSFARILDCVRRERALTCLTETDLPLSVISTRLGFAEPAVLSRCSRRWWGRTAAQMRTLSAGEPSTSI
jgi:AraC-like DNA-binding protein